MFLKTLCVDITRVQRGGVAGQPIYFYVINIAQHKPQMNKVAILRITDIEQLLREHLSERTFICNKGTNPFNSMTCSDIEKVPFTSRCTHDS